MCSLSALADSDSLSEQESLHAQVVQELDKQIDAEMNQMRRSRMLTPIESVNGDGCSESDQQSGRATIFPYSQLSALSRSLMSSPSPSPVHSSASPSPLQTGRSSPGDPCLGRSFDIAGAVMEVSRGVSTDPHYDTALHGLARPMEHLGPFGINPNVNITVDVVEDQQDPTRSHYKITGPKELCDHLATCNLAPEGRLSTICAATLETLSRRGKHIPLNAEYYAFMYPLSAVSKASSDQLTQCFGPGRWCAASGLLCFGGFVYFGKDREVLRINAFSDNDQFCGFFVFDGPYDLPVSVAEELQSKGIAQPVTLGYLRAQLGSRFAWIGPEDFSKHFGGCPGNITHGAFAYLFDNPKFNRYFRLTDGVSSAVELPEGLEAIVHGAGGFAMGYPATTKDGISYSLQNDIPYQLRLATALFAALGRSPNDGVVKSGRGHYEFTPDEPEPLGLRCVTLSTPLAKLTEPIVWSAASAEKYLGQWYTEPVIKECLEKAQVSSLEDIFGPGEYKICPKDLFQLEQSTTITTSPLLPPHFYRALLAITGDASHIQYFFDVKSVALHDFLLPGTPKPAMASNAAARAALAALLERVTTSPVDYGFADRVQLQETLSQSLTELSTNVLISQLGHFLVGNHNQIEIPTPEQVPILFLATAAIDFDEPDRHAAAQREEARYFKITKRLENGEVEGDWKSPEARQDFKTRLKTMYDMLFTRCMKAGVTHPGFLPIGLGAFLPRIQSDDVKTVYHEAQFELLAERDYRFKYYFLNPGPGRRQAQDILHNYLFKTNVVLHTKNGKFLAAELARAGYSTCCLNPSDCIAMMNGCMGYWWEVGKGSRYVGEEDIVATSTFGLSSKSISTAYDSARVIEHVPLNPTVIREFSLSI